jgi:hypothetical protein
MPVDMREWLPERHLVWLVLDAVAEMDLAVFYGGYRDDGHGRRRTRGRDVAAPRTAGDDSLESVVRTTQLQRLLLCRLQLTRRLGVSDVGVVGACWLGGVEAGGVGGGA